MFLALLRKYSEYSDEKLVEKYQKSLDTYYVALLFERYNELTVSMAMSYLKNKMDAEDATMDCFETLVKDLKDVKVENFGGWYYSVVRNLLLKYKRQNKKASTTSTDDYKYDSYQIESESKTEIDLKSLFEQEENRDLTNLIEGLLAEIKPEQADAIRKFYLEKKSYQEIAKEMNTPEKKVKSWIQNGKRNLRIKLENKNINSSHEIL